MSEKTDILSVAQEALSAGAEDWHSPGDNCCTCRLAQAVIDLSADKERLDWLQKRFGGQPWKLVGTIPGTNDIREAIDKERAALEGKDLGGRVKGGA